MWGGDPLTGWEHPLSGPAVMARTGGALATWSLSREYGFTGTGGSRPDWAAHWAGALAATAGPLGDPL